MYWSSEGSFLLPCTQEEARLLSQAVALHRAWSGVIARGLALVALEDEGLHALEAQLASLAKGGTLRLEREDCARLLPQLAEAFGALLRRAVLSKPSLEDVFLHKTGHSFSPRESREQGS